MTIISGILTCVQTINRIFRVIPASVFAVAYLLCIPGFAYKYAAIPNGFYQSNIRVESAYSADGKKVLDGLCSAVSDHLLRNAGKNLNAVDASTVTVPVGNSTFAPLGDIHCSRLTVIDDDRVRFSITVNLSGSLPPYRVYITATIAPEEERFTFYTPGQPDLIARPLELNIDEPYFAYRQKAVDTAAVVFDYGSERHFIRPAVLIEPLFDVQVFQPFVNETNGFTSDSGDNFARMLYFSAVTITTLGYGDIVPVLAQARRWVTAEAILGVILIGLFLNALSRERRSGGGDKGRREPHD